MVCIVCLGTSSQAPEVIVSFSSLGWKLVSEAPRDYPLILSPRQPWNTWAFPEPEPS